MILAFWTSSYFHRPTDQHRPNEVEDPGAVSGNVVADSWNTEPQADFYYVKGLVEECLLTNSDAEFLYGNGEYDNLHPGQTAKVLAMVKLLIYW